MSEKNLTNKQLEAIKRIKRNPKLLKRYKAENQFPELCLEAVKQNGYALQYVENQTTELCSEAVKEEAGAIRYIKSLTPELKMALYGANPQVLKYLEF